LVFGGKIVFQSSFMLTTAFGLGFVEALVELTDVRLAVVGPFSLGVGVVDIEAEMLAAAGSGPLEHLQVAVGVVGDGQPGSNLDDLRD
jgi:hypothetical protein